MIHPDILCGGSGTRLWSSSRKAYPKKFAPLLGDESLFQMTLARFAAPQFAAPLGAKHRMANPGKLPMYLIEVQTGSYFGEDGIIHYEDIYNRPERQEV